MKISKISDESYQLLEKPYGARRKWEENEKPEVAA